MTRTITIEAGEVDLPIDLQAVQEAGATWNGQTIDLTLDLVLDGRYEIIRAPITKQQAQLLLERLQRALNQANSATKA